jgi:hypothetical protein
MASSFFWCRQAGRLPSGNQYVVDRSGRLRGIAEIFNRLDNVPDQLRNNIFRESAIWQPIDSDDPVE